MTSEVALTDPRNHIVTIDSHGGWTTHEVTALIPDDTDTVAFGVFLAGPGQIELRDPQFLLDAPCRRERTCRHGK